MKDVKLKHTFRGLDPSPILQAELFSTLLDQEREVAVEHSSVLQLRRGARLFSAGERAERFYLLMEGEIRIFRPLEEGGREEMARFTSGDIIGDFDFARRGEYDANAEASKESVVILFPSFGTTMDDFALEDPSAVCRVLLGSITMLTSRIKKIMKVIVENMSWVQELNRQAYEDPGTGLWKQSYIDEEINRLLEVPTALIVLKLDRFKQILHTHGVAVVDGIMVRIALVLQEINHQLGRGWALRFKNNEVGLLINKTSLEQAETIVKNVVESIAALEPVPAKGDIPAFKISVVLSYGVWPDDEPVWENFLEGNLALLQKNQQCGENSIMHYQRGGTK
jgi:diguanylate cyclase (GGDEF)-like protein